MIPYSDSDSYYLYLGAQGSPSLDWFSEEDSAESDLWREGGNTADNQKLNRLHMGNYAGKREECRGGQAWACRLYPRNMSRPSS